MLCKRRRAECSGNVDGLNSSMERSRKEIGTIVHNAHAVGISVAEHKQGDLILWSSSGEEKKCFLHQKGMG